MALKGDTSQLSLANIIQTVQLNRQEGVLTVHSGKVRRKIRILPNGVRLIASAPDSLDLLQMAMVKQRFVTEAQFQNVVSTMNGTVKYPGDFLVQRRILTPEQVEAELAKQLQELLFEVLSWKDSKYEFDGKEVTEQLELFDPEGLGATLAFPTNSILMEAARRDDEWARIRGCIASEREIYAPVQLSEFVKPKVYKHDLPAEAFAEVKKFLDGKHTIESIIQETTLSAFEVQQIAIHLLEHKDIRPLTLKELKDLADELRRRFKLHDVVGIYRNILLHEPDDHDTRLKLVQIIEKIKMEREGKEAKDSRDRKLAGTLVEEYYLLAEHCASKGDLVNTKDHLRKVLEGEPGHLNAMEKLLQVHHQAKEHKEAIAIARRILETIKTKDEATRGTEILLKVVEMYPTEKILFHELADLFAQAGDKQNAIRCLQSVAAAYEKAGDLNRLRKTYERIVALDPNQAALLRKAQESERRATRQAPAVKGRRRRVAWSAAGVAAVLGLAYLVSVEILGRRTYAIVREDVELLLRADQYEQARRSLKSVASGFPLSTVQAKISSELAALATREREHRIQAEKSAEKANTHYGSVLARVESLLISKRHLEAFALLKDQTVGRPAGPNIQRIAAVEAQIVGHFTEAEELLAKARAQVQANRNEEGHRLFLRLMTNYPSTPSTRTLKLPLLLRTSPPGASVQFNGDTIGTTPLTIYYDPLARFNLVLSRRGYRQAIVKQESSDPRTFDFTRDWSLNVPLERVPVWTRDLRAPVEAVTTAQDGIVIAALRSGSLLAINVADGTERWSVALPDGWTPASGVTWWKERLCVGSSDGQFHILEAKSGRLLHRVQPLLPPKPIRHRASEATVAGLVVVNCGGVAAVAIHLATGGAGWIHRAEAEILGSPQLLGDTVVLAHSDGFVLGLDASSGAVRRRVSAGARLSGAGQATEEAYIVGDVSGHIRRIQMATGEVSWIYQAPVTGLTSPAIGHEVAFFGSDDGYFFALHLQTGNLKWKGRIPEKIREPALWRSGHFFLGTQAGRDGACQGISIDEDSGGLAWSFSSGAQLTAPALSGDLVIYGSEDQKLYAFDEP